MICELVIMSCSLNKTASKFALWVIVLIISLLTGLKLRLIHEDLPGLQGKTHVREASYVISFYMNGFEVGLHGNTSPFFFSVWKLFSMNISWVSHLYVLEEYRESYTYIMNNTDISLFPLERWETCVDFIYCVHLNIKHCTIKRPTLGQHI